MTSKQRWALWGGLVVLAAMMLSLGQPAAQAGTPPPRATLTPTPRSSTGTYIELRVPADNINLWTVVQWQDGSGNWHDVENWRGILDEIHAHTGNKIWWVLPGSYGAKPFRWLVYDRPGGNLLVASHAFALPLAKQHVIVEVKLK